MPPVVALRCVSILCIGNQIHPQVPLLSASPFVPTNPLPRSFPGFRRYQVLSSFALSLLLPKIRSSCPLSEPQGVSASSLPSELLPSDLPHSSRPAEARTHVPAQT